MGRGASWGNGPSPRVRLAVDLPPGRGMCYESARSDLRAMNLSDRRPRVRFLPALLGFFAATFCVSPVHSAIYYLHADGSGDFPTIQAAFDAASPGDEIVLLPGVYSEAEIIPSPGTILRGSGAPQTVVIDAAGARSCLYSVAWNAPNGIEGITFRGGSAVGLDITVGVAYIRNCVIRDCGVGMYLREMHGLIEGCTVVAGTTAGGTTGSGLSLSASSPTIRKCILAFNEGCGLVRWNGGAPNIDCCDFYANGGGNYCGTADLTGDYDNISFDPLFCDQDAGDYRISTASPCAADHSPCGDQIGALDPHCSTPPSGACCSEETGQCLFTTEAICDLGGAEWSFLPYAYCEPNPCPQPAGACCLRDVSCIMTSDEDCADREGHFQGYDAPCEPTPCSITGLGEVAGAHPVGRPRPNPTTGTSRVDLDLAETGRVTVEVFLPNGRLAGRIFDAVLAGGRHVVTWDGRDAGGVDLPSGLYFLRVVLGGAAETVAVQIVR